MKKYMLVLIAALLSFNCKGQNNDTKKAKLNETEGNLVEQQPTGTWKVDKEFDENGNLIRYDSIYSWSSDGNLNNLSTLERDSLLNSFKSRFFTNFSYLENQGFDDVFAEDSLFSKRFFNDDFFESNFGKDFMDIDKVTQYMLEKQRKFLEKYQTEFIKPEEEK